MSLKFHEIAGMVHRHPSHVIHTRKGTLLYKVVSFSTSVTVVITMHATIKLLGCLNILL